MWMREFNVGDNLKDCNIGSTAMNIKSFYLKGYENQLVRVGAYNIWNTMYKDKINNNLIVFLPQKKRGVSIETITNYIDDSPYGYLIDVLSNNKNVIVYWSQEFDQGSNYVILYDQEEIIGSYKTHRKFEEHLFSLSYMYPTLLNVQFAEFENKEVHWLFTGHQY